jgi:hypothetical protein
LARSSIAYRGGRGVSSIASSFRDARSCAQARNE